MSVSVFDPTTKLLIQLAQTALDKQLDMVVAKHAHEPRVADAVKAAKAAIDAAVGALVSLQ